MALLRSGEGQTSNVQSNTLPTEPLRSDLSPPPFLSLAAGGDSKQTVVYKTIFNYPKQRFRLPKYSGPQTQIFVIEDQNVYFDNQNIGFDDRKRTFIMNYLFMIAAFT